MNGKFPLFACQSVYAYYIIKGSDKPCFDQDLKIKDNLWHVYILKCYNCAFRHYLRLNLIDKYCTIKVNRS